MHRREIRAEEAAQLLEATQWVRQRVISEEDSDDSQYFRREIQVPDSDSRQDPTRIFYLTLAASCAGIVARMTSEC